ncbi:MAG TPA: BamA/TamA family outer membrane protein, partial [Vicinamibacteria bacterium]
RTLLGIEKAERPAIDKLNLFGFYPRIQGIAQGSRNALGVRFWQPDIDGSRISATGSAFVSVNKYQYYDFVLGRIAHGPEGGFPERTVKTDDVYELGQIQVRRGSETFTVAGFVRYEDYTQLDYYGLGNDSVPESQTNYRTRDTTAGLSVGWRYRHLMLAARGGVLETRLLSGTNDDVPSTEEVFDDGTAPGLTAAPDYWFFLAQAAWDRRDVAFNPKNGFFLGLQVSRYEDRRSDAFAFTRYGADARGYFSLGSPQRVVALRALYGNQDADDGARVPFYLQEFLGGSHTLRGFASFRFRGTDSLLLQAEYRWEPAGALELAAFVDAGQVAARSADLSLSELKTSYGVGLRIKTWQAVMVRMDLAWSEEGTRFLFRFSQAW